MIFLEDFGGDFGLRPGIADLLDSFSILVTGIPAEAICSWQSAEE
jgi:hypothetical protein